MGQDLYAKVYGVKKFSLIFVWIPNLEEIWPRSVYITGGKYTLN